MRSRVQWEGAINNDERIFREGKIAAWRANAARTRQAILPTLRLPVLSIASRADGSHVRVAVFIVNNRPETMERIRPHVKVGSSHDAAVRRGNSRVPGAALHRVRDTR